MTVLDLMAFLFWFSVACLGLAFLDALWLLVVFCRDRRRVRRMLCACGSWPFEDECPVLSGGWLHERSRCFPPVES